MSTTQTAPQPLTADPGELSIAQARGIVNDLFQPVAWIYWTDFLLSISLGVVGFTAIRRGHLINFILGGLELEHPAFRYGLYGLFFVVSCLAFYRASLFTHELIHLRDGEVRGFRVAWNVMCGIPLLMPSFMYHTHVHHHMRRHYGTKEDGEYLRLASGPPRNILLYLAQSFVLPIIAAVRFLLLTPLTWISPWVRDFVHQRMSSMVVDPTYIRPLPTRRQRLLWRLQEAGCFAFCVTIAVLLATRTLPLMWLVHAYATATTVILLNAVRTIGAHRYRCRGGEVAFVDQILDSVNYPRQVVFNELLMPVGLRYHALHHLFPSLPYHGLAKAHRRLMAELPADSPYRQTESPSLWATVRQLVREAWENTRGKQAEEAGATQRA
ncbi:MAG: fatty acid desaturase [Planctomycetes bacterium]|nr:fatty acid desaturase [Planctomycetia bacterium]MBI3463765.1 fatty acid desaturase [Planctomycetota bacterium]